MAAMTGLPRALYKIAIRKSTILMEFLPAKFEICPLPMLVVKKIGYSSNMSQWFSLVTNRWQGYSGGKASQVIPFESKDCQNSSPTKE